MSEENAPEVKVARLRYAGEDQFIGESPSGHAVIASFAHDHSTAATPMELLLIALGGCTGADVSSILQKKRQRVTAYEIEVRGQRRDEHPRIYTHIEIIHKLKGYQLDVKAVARAIELSESKYCSVSAMLHGSTIITSRYEIEPESEPQG
ncbi:MAG: OsmC family protein [Acidobacteria bacterium]|nr:OsmC family protein [Acidobacteriota bacterium]